MAKTKAKAGKAKAKGGKPTKVVGSLRANSIKSWLATRLEKDELAVADAIKHAEAMGRSKVTVYRQAGELGFRAQGGLFVKGGVKGGR